MASNTVERVADEQSTAPTAPLFRYMRLADDMEHQIQGGVYRAGEKLPSIRKMHRRTGFSITTVYQAYIELEKRGVVEPAPKSGFFVKPRLRNILAPPRLKKHTPLPRRVAIHELVNAIIEAMSDPEMISLGAGAPSPDLLPHRELLKLIRSRTYKQAREMLTRYERPSGSVALRREIAKRTAGGPLKITEEDILITNGCMEAISVCLRTVARPGDTILVESPCFHCFLQLIEDQNMLALEVPADPETGIDLESLESALDTHDVRACILNPNFQNPTGALMPESAKKRLVRLLADREIPVIEDNIYGDLHFDRKPPATLKSLDEKGLVLYCSSFSKTLSPGLRVGWTLPGRFLEQARRVKINTSITSPSFNQEVIADFLKTGGYDRHLRRLRGTLKAQVSNTALAIARHFPEDTRITAPRGGMVLWVEMNEAVDAMAVFREAMKAGIAIVPGVVCAASDRYRNCIRVSCGSPWDDRLAGAIARLGKIVTAMHPAAATVAKAAYSSR